MARLAGLVFKLDAIPTPCNARFNAEKCIGEVVKAARVRSYACQTDADHAPEAASKSWLPRQDLVAGALRVKERARHGQHGCQTRQRHSHGRDCQR